VDTGRALPTAEPLTGELAPATPLPGTPPTAGGTTDRTVLSGMAARP
jgi:hypothetical protein